LSALPYFVLWVLSFLFSAIADFLIIKSYTSIGTTRKIFNSIGLVIPAVALVFLGFMDEEHQNLAIALLVVAVGMNSAIYSGFNVNHMDISPNHSGTLMGITNCVSNIFSLLAPLFVQVIVTDEVGPPPDFLFSSRELLFLAERHVAVADGLLRGFRHLCRQQCRLHLLRLRRGARLERRSRPGE
jgi:sugar phosphate permease